jgi:hypothetical protein
MAHARLPDVSTTKSRSPFAKLRPTLLAQTKANGKIGKTYRRTFDVPKPLTNTSKTTMGSNSNSSFLQPAEYRWTKHSTQANSSNTHVPKGVLTSRA